MKQFQNNRARTIIEISALALATRSNNPHFFADHGVGREHFAVREIIDTGIAFDFLASHIAEYGVMPSHRTFIAQFPRIETTLRADMHDHIDPQDVVIRRLKDELPAYLEYVREQSIASIEDLVKQAQKSKTDEDFAKLFDVLRNHREESAAKEIAKFPNTLSREDFDAAYYEAVRNSVEKYGALNKTFVQSLESDLGYRVLAKVAPRVREMEILAIREDAIKAATTYQLRAELERRGAVGIDLSAFRKRRYHLESTVISHMLISANFLKDSEIHREHFVTRIGGVCLSDAFQYLKDYFDRHGGTVSKERFLEKFPGVLLPAGESLMKRADAVNLLKTLDVA